MKYNETTILAAYDVGNGLCVVWGMEITYILSWSFPGTRTVSYRGLLQQQRYNGALLL